jgi:hypothetical protein
VARLIRATNSGALIFVYLNYTVLTLIFNNIILIIIIIKKTVKKLNRT